MRQLRLLLPVWIAIFGALLSAPAVAARAPAAPGAVPSQADDGGQAADESFEERVNRIMGRVNHFIGGGDDPETPDVRENHWGFFRRVPTGMEHEDGSPVEAPLLVFWLVIGATFFTLRFGFVQLRAFRHAIAVTRGKYDNPEDEGEVSHFQALTAALSATVGLGNIAGVAIAISIGGPGATFWMICAGLLGMASKFAECTLGQMYRQVRSDGSVMGGAMYYLSVGLKEKHLGPIGLVLAVLFAILCMGGSLAGGNAFQVSQSLGALKQSFPSLEGSEWVYGLIMTTFVAIVILGGIRRIAATAEKIVPFMCALYVVGCLYVLISNLGHVGPAFSQIVDGAFTLEAGWGGLIGVLVVGFQRAAFSNEAGIGSAAIAHSAARTPYAVREGIVALLEPFIDTVVVCTMTALVIVITGAYQNPDYAQYVTGNDGAALTSVALRDSIGSWAPYVLSVAVVLFAYSTMIAWSYYGETLLDVALRRPLVDHLPADLPRLRVPGIDHLGHERARVRRPHDPRHGLPEHPGGRPALG